MLRSSIRPLRWMAMLMLGWSCTLLVGCANFYVDNGLRDADQVQYTKPATPKPVQLFFSFQTKGSANARATDFLKAEVTDLVKQSGLFSEIKDVAGPDTGVLQITLNNIPLNDDAVAKGFMTGLTLGLAGNTVGDGYVCDLQYKRSDASAPIDAKVSHAIYTSIGNSSGPSAATKVKGMEEAIRTMTSQAVKSLLKKLSDNPQFKDAQ